MNADMEQKLDANPATSHVLGELAALWDRFAAVDPTLDESKGYAWHDRSNKEGALRDIAYFVLFPEMAVGRPRGHNWDSRLSLLAVDVGYFAQRWMGGKSTKGSWVESCAYTLVHSLSQGGLCSGARLIAVQKAEKEIADRPYITEAARQKKINTVFDTVYKETVAAQQALVAGSPEWSGETPEMTRAASQAAWAAIANL